MNFLYKLIYIYIFTKPFYIFKSGTMQISDFILSFAFIIFLLIIKSHTKLSTELNKNKQFFIFTILTFFVNFIYFLIYLKFKFILSSLYFLFNFLAIILFSYCTKVNDTLFLKNIRTIFKIDLIIQLLLYLLKLGRYYDTVRYMGTFNDPNQYAYFVLLSFSFIYLIDISLKDSKYQFVYFFISIYLIYASASTGMLLGMCVFLIFYMVNIFKNLNSFIKKNRFKLIIFTFIITFSIIFLNLTNVISLSNILYNNPIIDRVEDKLSRTSKKNTSSNSLTIWQERGYDKLYIYPKYLIYGSGEGEYNRFYLSAHTNEIHATLPSIWFYYGIIPFIIILSWFYKKLKGIPFSLLIIYIALLTESFTLLNQRQALFWVIFALSPYLTKLFKNKNK